MLVFIKIGLQDNGTTYYLLMNHGFASLILMQEFVFDVIVGIVMNKIILSVSKRLVVVPLWYRVEY